MRALAGASVVVALAMASCGSDAPPTPTIAFRPLVLSYLVGAYDGSCAPVPDGASAPGTVELAASGDVDAPGVAAARGALLDRSMSYTIRRDLDAAGPTAIGLSIDDGTDAGLAVEMTSQQGSLVRVRQGPPGERTGTACTGAAAAVDRLRDTPLFPLVAELLTTPAARPFRCAGPAGDARRDYEVDPAGARLGDERWSFTAGLARERLYVGPVAEGDRLVYEVRLLDGRSFAAQVDDRGVTGYLLTRPSPDGEYTECRPA